GGWLQIDLDSAHHRSHGSDAGTLQRILQIAHEQLNEPWTIASLERELLVVDDNRVHRLTRSAARWPLRTALSIVAGRPVSVQSPARKNLSSGVAAPGRGGCPGA